MRTARQSAAMRMTLCAIVIAMLGCGPGARGGDDQSGDAGYTGPTGVIRGRVWAPGLAPGMTTAGEEIPVAGAAVYLTSTRPAAIPSGVYCEPCQAAPAGAVITDHAGAFVLPEAIPGRRWLVIQKAQFRLELELDVTTGDVTLDATQTTLPSQLDPANGKWIPRIAIAAGSYDHLQNIFGKMGIGAVDASGEYTTTGGKLDLVDNGGATLGMSAGTLADLARDPVKLASYHVVFIPCSGDNYTSALSDQQVLKNLRDYVKNGGKLYVTDWSGEWMDNVFPQQIELGEGGFGGNIDTPATAYTAATDTWTTSQFGSADGDAYDSNDADAIDPNLASWLGAQRGPAPSGGSGPINAHDFDAVDNWNFIQNVHPVQVGVDMNGQPVIDTPKAWVTGTNSGPFGGGSRHPLTVTFEPAGCGRVLYSTYHTTETAHAGLYPQERILLYLIMEIGVCSDNPVIL
ncbi:MAG: Tryptophan synthase alpha chain [Deltaproteobacteria bacterium]|nr:Tryptophan synthase alpha chain [Deltaproteobacteria bacterium]